MNDSHIRIISAELGIKSTQASAVLSLIAEGGTVPFIARYRKEATGSLDEVVITSIRDRAEQLEALDKRRDAIITSLTERELLTPELEEQVRSASTMVALEDIYLPYKPKRRTRATIAREKGLAPLAELILAQSISDPLAEALAFVDPEKGVNDATEALAGARDIIAETINENADARTKVRSLFRQKATLAAKVMKGKEETGAKFRDYFNWNENAAAAPSHRVLAVLRGESEEVLSVCIQPPEEDAISILHNLFVKGEGSASLQVAEAATDAYRRLMSLSLETEFRNEIKEAADAEAIRVFAENLRELLLAAPLGSKSILAIDPGFRTGCKVVCLDNQGTLITNTTIYPHGSDSARAAAAAEIQRLIAAHSIEAIAIGNGTAGRETESFVRDSSCAGSLPIIMVNESGASIYSASDAAREEFPDHDITVRGSVSIGRRLMDPLAELVKIEPRSIGVGQYQHDVDQKALGRSLDDVVISCVNAVGVDVNTASPHLLSYVSGLNMRIARNIITFRAANGHFRSRRQLLKVPGLGPKTFEQAAGFLRIRGGDNPLDASAVHPESYHVVDSMAADLAVSPSLLITDESLRNKISIEKYVRDGIGLPTLRDIMAELSKPGRDPRNPFEVFSFADGVNEITDLTPGMKLPGKVTNVTAFGAFVDIGVHQDGLVHISQLADKFVRTPSDVVKAGQKVTVTVVEVDEKRRRISLSMKENPARK